MLDTKYFYRDILKNFFIDYSKHNWLAVVFALLKERTFLMMLVNYTTDGQVDLDTYKYTFSK